MLIWFLVIPSSRFMGQLAVLLQWMTHKCMPSTVKFGIGAWIQVLYLVIHRDMLNQLVQQLEKRQGSEIDLASWLSCLSYDVIYLVGHWVWFNGLSHLQIRFYGWPSVIYSDRMKWVPSSCNLNRFGGAFRLLEQGSDVEGYMILSKLTMRFVSCSSLSIDFDVFNY